MKTTILQLDTHDDLNSILDKLNWCKSRRILLVFQKKSRFSPEVLDLKLIQRNASSLGAEIVLVTANPRISDLAKVLNITVFRSVPRAELEAAMENTVSPSFRPEHKGIEYFILEKHRLPREGKGKGKDIPLSARFSVFVLPIVALFVLASYLVPTAVVKVYPLLHEQQIEMDVTVTTSVDDISLAGLIPGRLDNVILSGSLIKDSTGTIEVGQGYARGSVSIINLSGVSITLPEGTIFSTIEDSPVRFITQTEVTLTPDLEQVNLPVVATQTGNSGNIGKGVRLISESDLDNRLTANSTKEFTGGVSINVPSPSIKDYETLKEQLIEQLKNQALTQLQQNLPSGQVILNYHVSDIKELETTELYPMGEPSSQAELSMSVQFGIISYKITDVQRLSELVMDLAILKDEEGVGSVEFLDLSEPVETTSESYSWKIRTSRQLKIKIDMNQMREQIAGMKIEDAIDILELEIPGTKPAEIKPFLKIWNRMPYIPSQIFVEEVIST